MLLYKFAYSIG